ncbi:hypothetical protein ILYODFUR_024256 [Ilyodon furcidens]|uniref:VIT domain-containing protein n=1 Tax=Ilyodon furcidens TaxID=33524 RepID=A0ABV0TMD0_9TELE
MDTVSFLIQDYTAVAEPHYMVFIPAVLEAGAETKFCASLMEPNETLTMTVTLRSEEKNTTLREKTSREEFLECIQFQWVAGELVPVSPAVCRRQAGYTLDRSPVHHRAPHTNNHAHSHSYT